MEQVVEFLKKYWFILSFIVGSSVAWGQNTLKVQSLEDAVKANAETATQVKVLEDRTKGMKEEQDHQRGLLEQILQNQQQQTIRPSIRRQIN